MSLQIMNNLRASISKRAPFQSVNILTKLIVQPQRQSSFRSSKPVGNLNQYTSNYEISKNPEEWKLVEQLIAPKLVPEPILKPVYPSGWTPQSDTVKDGPFFISRTNNHMQPVYLSRTYRGMRRITVLQRIHGDIWALEHELRGHIEQKNNKQIASQVNEVSGKIYFKGDYVNDVKEWLTNKGF